MIEPILRMWSSDAKLDNETRNSPDVPQSVILHAAELLKSADNKDRLCTIETFAGKSFLFACASHPTDFRHRMVEVYAAVFPTGQEQNPTLRLWHQMVRDLEPIATRLLACRGGNQSTVDVAAVQSACAEAIDIQPDQIIPRLLLAVAELSEIDLPENISQRLQQRAEQQE